MAELEQASSIDPAIPQGTQMALVADPALLDKIQATSSTKEEPKRPLLPPLQPGHKVNALSLRESSPSSHRALGSLHHHCPFFSFHCAIVVLSLPFSSTTEILVLSPNYYRYRVTVTVTVTVTITVIDYRTITIIMVVTGYVAKLHLLSLVLPILLPVSQSSSQKHSYSSHLTAIPSKVEEAFRLYRYVPYTLLSHTARSRAVKGDDSTFVLTPEGFTIKPLDRSNELSISPTDWMAASKVAEERTRVHHGAERAEALSSHHGVVLGISVSHNWLTAMYYDTQQRELAHSNPEHNLAGADVTALTMAFQRALALGHQPLPHASTKRSAPSDFQTSPRKKSSHLTPPTSHCFWCGCAGHLPAQCNATTTAAGRPAAPTVPNGRSKNTLASPKG